MTDSLQEAFDALLRGDSTDLDSYLRPIAMAVPIDGTLSKAHSLMVRFGPTGTPRTKDLAARLALRIIEYAIPRSEIVRANEIDIRKNTTSESAALFQKARHLFASTSSTGEPGEILLYMLAQIHLRMPQLFCKMPHKTNPAVHYHGADGIHARLGASGDSLVICFAQVKLVAESTSAMKGCIDDIQHFLCDDGGSASTQERDLQLMRDYIDLNNDVLEEAILHYLDPDHPDYLKLSFQGLCLAGFNAIEYHNDPPMSESETHSLLNSQMSTWSKKMKTLILKRPPLHTRTIDFFLVPVPSVQDLRDAFLKELGLVP